MGTTEATLRMENVDVKEEWQDEDFPRFVPWKKKKKNQDNTGKALFLPVRNQQSMAHSGPSYQPQRQQKPWLQQNDSGQKAGLLYQGYFQWLEKFRWFLAALCKHAKEGKEQGAEDRERLRRINTYL